MVIRKMMKVLRPMRTNLSGWTIFDGNGFDRFRFRTFWAYARFVKTRNLPKPPWFQFLEDSSNSLKGLIDK